VKLKLTLDMSRDLAGRLSARPIHEGKDLEPVLIEILSEPKAT
jgi:hypothetical protein